MGCRKCSKTVRDEPSGRSNILSRAAPASKAVHIWARSPRTSNAELSLTISFILAMAVEIFTAEWTSFRAAGRRILCIVSSIYEIRGSIAALSISVVE